MLVFRHDLFALLLGMVRTVMAAVFATAINTAVYYCIWYCFLLFCFFFLILRRTGKNKP